MGKIPVSSLATIALAVPLGIGGLTLTAPVTAADARANIAHHFGTCSVHVIWKCAQGYRNLIFNDFRDLFNNSGWYERGANGADQKTFGALNWRRETNFEGTGERSRQYLLRVFGDGDIDAGFDHPHRGLGFISPESRQRYVREVEEPRRRAAEEAAAEVQRREAFKDRCVEMNGRVTENLEGVSLACDVTRYVEREVEGISFRQGYNETIHYDPDAEDSFALQVTPIEPLGSLAEIEAIEDHQQATSDNRGRIVELQEEATDHDGRLQELEPVVERNVQVVEALGNSVGLLSEAVTSLVEDTARNTAGIALAYALDAPGLSYGRRFAITGAFGKFRGENAVGFSGTFKAGEHVLISVGGGFAGSGDSSVNGGKVSATYEW